MSNGAFAVSPSSNRDAQPDDPRLAQLIARLPDRLQATIGWLRRPSSRWARIAAAVLLICGGLLSILPVLGLWMLPLGLALLADDAPPLRRARGRVLDWIERRWPVLLRGRPETTTRIAAETHMQRARD
jgi:hypothetical protein